MAQRRKIKRITQAGTGAEKNLSFTYDPSGNGLSKKVYDASHNLLYANDTFLDASGNPMALYKRDNNPQEQSSTLHANDGFSRPITSSFKRNT